MRTNKQLVAGTVSCLFLSLSGCMLSTEIREFRNLAPVPPKGESRPIMFKKLVGKLNRGQEIGTIQVGLACVGQGKIFWKRGGQHQVGDDELSDILKEELVKTGYQVVGDSNSLFEEPHEWKAEFLLAGVVKHVAINKCFPLAGFGNFTNSSGEASMEVEWQLFERRTRSVVHTVTTGGTARTDQGPSQADQAYYDAFSASVRNFLADQQVASFLSRQPSQPLAFKSPYVLDTFSVEKVDPGQGRELVQYAHGTVVTIPIGSGHGSGVIVSPDGYVLTNAHVVGSGDKMVTVELPTGRRITGDVVRQNPDVDVALIRLEKGKYLAAPVGSSSSLRVGQPVYAIGTPLDERFSRTVTSGVISAFRDENDRKLIQSDVSVLPGNSGGPLLDEFGRVVGVTKAGMFMAGTVGVGLNYFIPIEEAWSALQINPKAIKISAKELSGNVSQSMTEAPSTTSNAKVKQDDLLQKLRLIQELREKKLISEEEANTRTKSLLDQSLK